MLLIAFVFLLLTIREFLPKFQFFKSVVLAGAVALLLMNFSVPNARVAEYNIDRYLSGESSELDVEYLHVNSADSLLVLNESKKELEDIAALVEDLNSDENSNSRRYLTRDMMEEKEFYEMQLEDDWLTFNVSRVRVILQDD